MFASLGKMRQIVSSVKENSDGRIVYDAVFISVSFIYYAVSRLEIILMFKYSSLLGFLQLFLLFILNNFF